MTKRKRSKAAPRPRTAQRRTAKKGPGQLVITLAAANGEIAKIEILEPAGSRRTVSETEFARLLGDNSEMDEICEAIAEAYAAGVRDGFDDALFDGLSADVPHHPPQVPAGGQIARSGIGKIALRRALRRGSPRGTTTAAHNGVKDAR